VTQGITNASKKADNNLEMRFSDDGSSLYHRQVVEINEKEE